MGETVFERLWQSGHFFFQDCSTLIKEEGEETEAAILAVSVEPTSQFLQVVTGVIIAEEYQALRSVVKSLGGGWGFHFAGKDLSLCSRMVCLVYSFQESPGSSMI